MLAAIEKCAAEEGAGVVAISAAIEAQIADLPDEDKKVFLADMECRSPG
jgi:ribosome-binding ATPase YchF (GTP1/OBG family)